MEKKIMIDRVAKLTNPLLILVALVLGTMISNSLFDGNVKTIIINLITILSLFVFGMLLSYRRKNNKSWIKKVIISLLIFVIVLIQLDIAQFNTIFKNIEIITKNTAILHAIIIYCGWAFFE
jgi:peptidoglycan/LPS O-acetylase OafA/YrhL